MNKQQLAAKIWESANKMRSKIEANEYKDYILGFIFYKFLSEKETRYLKELGYSEEDLPTVTEEEHEIVENVQKNIGYFIEYNNLFSTWLDKGSDFNVSDVHDALSAFERLISPTHKKVFKGIFNTLSSNLTKLGTGAASQTKAISDLIQLIKDIPMDGKQDYDVLGFIYEYLISNFAANAGKKAGEFYTPHEVSILMSEIVANHLKNRNEICIYDPTSGSGSLLINIGKSVAKYNGDNDQIKYYAQEWKENTYNLTRMNLVMRGILPSNIVARNGDTLEEDWPFFEENDPIGTYSPLYLDAVVSNPPYSQAWNPKDKEGDPRYADYGLAPKGKADYAFLLHDLYHIKPDGIMTIVLPHGVLFRGGEEGTIRKNLIENNKIDAIIGLPANIFFGTGIPTIIMVLRQKRENTDILIIDASKGFEKVGKNNKLRACDIKKIADTYINRVDVPKFAKVVSREEVRANDYNLNIPRYVDSSEKTESWDIYASMFGGVPGNELDDFEEYWKAFPGLKEKLFENINEQYFNCVSNNIKNSILECDSVRNFISSYNDAFSGFDDYLKKELIQSLDVVNISKEEAILSSEINKRINNKPLIDFYGAYQLLDEDWGTIAVDLEIIQTEGRDSLRQVDPNLVIKKKDNKDTEVQEGWKGHVFPFELVQNLLFTEQLNDIKESEDRLSQISAEYEEALDNLSEEDKECDFVNEDKTAFVWAEVKKAIKAKEVDESVIDVLKKAQLNNEEEKELKKNIKEKNDTLHLATKEKIESLSDDEINMLLFEKWINPLCVNLAQIPDSLISDFAKRIDQLSKKYSITFEEVEKEINSTEKELSNLLNELTGNEFDMKGIEELKGLLGK